MASIPITSAKNVVYNNSEMTADDFAIIINELMYSTKGVVLGCALEANGKDIEVGSGYAVAYGRIINVSSDRIQNVPLALESGTNGYVVMTVNIGLGTVVIDVSTTEPGSSGMQDSVSSGLNSGIAYVELGQYTVSETGVSFVKSADKITTYSAALKKVSETESSNTNTINSTIVNWTDKYVQTKTGTNITTSMITKRGHNIYVKFAGSTRTEVTSAKLTYPPKVTLSIPCTWKYNNKFYTGWILVDTNGYISGSYYTSGSAALEWKDDGKSQCYTTFAYDTKTV